MREQQNMEWKESWRDDYLRWICGFANAEGGVLETECMVEACRLAGLEEPVLAPEAGGFWVTFAFAQPPNHEEATGSVSEKTSEKILQAILENDEITIADLAELVEVTTRSVERNIRKLQEEKKLRRIGPDKGGRWEVLK